MSAFEEFGVMPSLISALESLGWDLPRPVQTEAIPLILGGGDVAVAAETGAGKTGAFCVPILQTVLETLLAPGRPAVVDPNSRWELSPFDRSRDVAVDGHLTQCRRGGWQGVRASRGVARGRWYFVAVPDDEGLCRVGFSSSKGSLVLGTDRFGFGFGGTGMKSHSGKFDAYGVKYSKSDMVCCLVSFSEDGSTFTVSFTVNGRDLGAAFDNISVDRIGGDGILFPAVTLKNAQIAVDFARECDAAEAKGYRLISKASVQEQTESLVCTLKEDSMEVEKMEIEKPRKPSALILEPSRELADQVNIELGKLSATHEGQTVRRVLLVGGGKPQKELSALRSGVDIVTGTLGSVMKHVTKGALSLEDVRFFVLDEADTFANDNLGDVLKLHGGIPPRNHVQTLLFSATLHSPEILGLSEAIQRFPTWIDLKGQGTVPDTVHHTLVRLDADADGGLVTDVEHELCKEGAPFFGKVFPWPTDGVHKTLEDAADSRSAAMKTIKLAALKKVIDANDMQHAMLFARTKQDCDNIENFLLFISGIRKAGLQKARFNGSRESGPEVMYSCSVLHGGRLQEERRAALNAFRNREVRFLVCTDVAARGIDITGLPFLVNVTLPDKSANYLHRVGRVGRSGFMGLAVSLVSSQKEAMWFHTCNKVVDGQCNNRKLVDLGGCVIWYNEPKLLVEIESRLGGAVEELDAKFRRKGGLDAPPLMYGTMQDEAEMGVTTAAHIESLKPAVRDLVRMEHDVQSLFFRIQGDLTGLM